MKMALIIGIILTLAVFLQLPMFSAMPQEGRGPDGHFHDPLTGEAQPDMCDNGFKNEHPCSCSRADTKCDHDASNEHPSPQCKTYCRTDKCGCVSGCS